MQALEWYHDPESHDHQFFFIPAKPPAPFYLILSTAWFIAWARFHLNLSSKSFAQWVSIYLSNPRNLIISVIMIFFQAGISVSILSLSNTSISFTLKNFCNNVYTLLEVFAYLISYPIFFPNLTVSSYISLATSDWIAFNFWRNV